MQLYQEMSFTLFMHVPIKHSAGESEFSRVQFLFLFKELDELLPALYNWSLENHLAKQNKRNKQTKSPILNSFKLDKF